MLDIRDLQVFVRTVALGSISAAGREIGLSAAAASQRLSHLESELDTRLLQRTTRKLSLTSEGEELYGRAVRILQDLDDAQSAVTQKSGEVKGNLRVTIPASFGNRYIAPALPEFLEQNPQMSVELLVTESYVDLLESGLDLAIRIGEVHGAELAMRRLAPNRRVLCASLAYLQRCGTPEKLEDLEKHECITSFNRTELSFEGPPGERTISVSGRFSTNNGAIIRDAAIAGVGIAVKSTWDIADAVRDGRLRVVLPDWQILPKSAIYAVYPTRRYIPARVKAFVEFYRNRFNSEGLGNPNALLGE